MKKIALTLAAAASSVALIAGAAPASAYTMDADGFGWVGKGEVQTALGLNNNQLQKGTFAFTYQQTTEQETSWTCVNANNGYTQERENTTTITSTGVNSVVARENSKGKDGAITGFHLQGFREGSTTTSTSTSGNKLYSCPNPASTFYLEDSEVVGDTVVTGGGLYVNGVLLP